MRTFDVAILDEDGNELVAIDRFAIRLLELADILAAGAAGAGTPDDDTGTLLAPDEALELMWRMLAAPPAPRYVVSREPMAVRSRRVARMSAEIEGGRGGGFATTGVRSAVAAGDAAGSAGVEATILDLWQDAFGLDQVGLDEDFFDLGGNSLVAVQMAMRIREQFGVALSGVIVLEFPTARLIAQHVEGLLTEPAGQPQ